jgi:hypothetical protein
MKALRVGLVVALALGLTGMALAGAGGGGRAAGGGRGMVMGTLTKIDGAKLTVSQPARGGGEATERVVETTDKTEFYVDGETAALKDLVVEMSVQVVNVPATDEAAARQVVNATSKDSLRGTVKSVDGKNVVVTTGRGDTAKDVTVVTDDSTKVLVSAAGRGFTAPKAGKLEDVKAGMGVVVVPATGTAKKLIVSPARAPRGGGAGGAA